MHRGPLKQKANALLICIMTVVMVAAMASTYLMSSLARTNNTNAKNENVVSYYAAEAGIEMGIVAAWDDYLTENAGTAGSPTEYRAYLDSIGLTDGLTLQILNDQAYQQATIDSVTIRRTDSAGGETTQLGIRATGSFGRRGAKTLLQTLSIEGGLFKGFDFALLSNNINCIMCHAQIDTVERIGNTDSNEYGNFDRIKVGSLESLMIRSTSAESHIAGSLYTRGSILDRDGSVLTDLAGTTLRGYQIDSNGKIVEDGFGTMTEIPLSPTSNDTDGNPLTNGSLYLDYPGDPDKMTDGQLPSAFPPAIPDTNDNKIVDDDEFASVVTSAKGQISGGILYNVPAGSTYTQGAMPTVSNLSKVDGSVTGNLVLIGTESNPIVLDKNIAVDGDVVIKGVVKGTGQIYARGNLYVVGDVTYADGTDTNGNRTFGLADDGTKNTLALTAGGNIATGDYLTPSALRRNADLMNPKDIDPGDRSVYGTSEQFSFAMTEITLFNRAEWTKTQMLLPDRSGKLVTNPLYIKDYTPRYYTMGPGDPVYIYNKYNGRRGTYFDAASQTWKGNEETLYYDLTQLTEIPMGNTDLDNATVINLAPTSGWMSESELKRLWIEDENQRKDGQAFQIDALMYTNNALFNMSRRKSKTNGQMIVNGSIVAADTGILVPGNGGVGLQLNYDQRLKQFLKIKDSQVVDLVRKAFVVLR